MAFLQETGKTKTKDGPCPSASSGTKRKIFDFAVERAGERKTQNAIRSLAINCEGNEGIWKTEDERRKRKNEKRTTVPVPRQAQEPSAKSKILQSNGPGKGRRKTQYVASQLIARENEGIWKTEDERRKRKTKNERRSLSLGKLRNQAQNQRFCSRTGQGKGKRKNEIRSLAINCEGNGGIWKTNYVAPPLIAWNREYQKNKSLDASRLLP